jgi:hypothetical protein
MMRFSFRISVPPSIMALFCVLAITVVASVQI